VGGTRTGLRAVLHKPHFLTFAVTQSVSLFGDKLDYMALLALIAWFSGRTGIDSSRAIAALSVVAALPTVLFAPIAGVLVDRADRGRVMIACDVARALLVLALPVVALRLSNLPLTLTIAFAVFLCGLFFNTARLSIIPDLVGAEADAPGVKHEASSVKRTASSVSLLAANSLMSFTGRVATLGGMVAGGFIVDWTGWHRFGITPSWTAGFYIDALTYVVSVVGLLFIYRGLGSVPNAERRASNAGTSITNTIRARLARFTGEMADGWKLAIRTPVVLFVYCSTIALVFAGAGFLVLYVPLIQGTGFDLGTRGVGIIAGIGSVGLLLSALGYGAVGSRLPRHSAILIAFLVISLCTVTMAMTGSPTLVAVAVFLAGCAMSPIYIAMDTLLHESVPAAIRGRIFSNREWVMHLAFGLAALTFGLLTRVAANRTLLFAIGVLVAAASIGGFILTRRHDFGRPLHPEEEP
jgi:dTMP kinase